MAQKSIAAGALQIAPRQSRAVAAGSCPIPEVQAAWSPARRATLAGQSRPPRFWFGHLPPTGVDHWRPSARSAAACGARECTQAQSRAVRSRNPQASWHLARSVGTPGGAAWPHGAADWPGSAPAASAGSAAACTRAPGRRSQRGCPSESSRCAPICPHAKGAEPVKPCPWSSTAAFGWHPFYRHNRIRAMHPLCTLEDSCPLPHRGMSVYRLLAHLSSAIWARSMGCRAQICAVFRSYRPSTRILHF